MREPNWDRESERLTEEAHEGHYGYSLNDPRRLSRRSDPATSRLAAEHVVEAGDLEAVRLRALRAVREHPGLTARELSAAAGESDERTIGRRLNEIESCGWIKRGAVRPCSLTDRPCATWWPVEDEPAEDGRIDADDWMQ